MCVYCEFFFTSIDIFLDGNEFLACDISIYLQTQEKQQEKKHN